QQRRRDDAAAFLVPESGAAGDPLRAQPGRWRRARLDLAGQRDRVARADRDFTLTGEGPPERYTSYGVSAAFFDALGVRPQLGRTFRRGEDEAGRAQVAVLKHSFWQKRFGGDPGIVGRQIMLDDKPFEI